MYEPQSLTSAHDLSQFDSGEPDLDRWLRDNALKQQERSLSRTFVLVDDVTGQVVAYYTLLAHTVEKATLPSRQRSSVPERVPAVLLAKLAVDVSAQGRGLGRATLVDAIGRVVHTSTNLGVRLLMVDALNQDVVAFYERRKFQPLPGDPLRLYLRISPDLIP